MKKVITTLVVLVVAGLIVKFVPLRKRDIVDIDVEESPETVVSIDQKGGITAHTVNIKSDGEKRHLDEESKRFLDKHLPNDKDKQIKIKTVFGDQEALQLSMEVKDYLESQRWKNLESTREVFSEPVFGARIKETSDGSIEIIIGAKP